MDERAASLPLSYAPGERFNYGTRPMCWIHHRSGGGSACASDAGIIVHPLSMVDTTLGAAGKAARAAVLYQSPAPGTFTPLPLAGFLDESPPVITAGGQGLVSNR